MGQTVLIVENGSFTCSDTSEKWWLLPIWFMKAQKLDCPDAFCRNQEKIQTVCFMKAFYIDNVLRELFSYTKMRLKFCSSTSWGSVCKSRS